MRQAVDHLFAHVVADIRVAEQQVFQEQVHATAGLHFLQRQLQCAGPATDATVEPLDLLAVDVHRHAQLQQRLHLVVLECQLAGIKQQQLMLDPQLGHAQLRQPAAAHQQGHPARHVPQEEAQPGDQLTLVQHFEFVEHDQDRLVLARQFGQQLGEQRIQRDLALLGECRGQRATGIELAVQRLGQVATELQRQVVTGMQLQPGDASIEGPRPLRSQGGLAEAAGGVQHGQAYLRQAQLPLVQSRAFEQARRQHGDRQLGGDQRQQGWHRGIHGRLPVLVIVLVVAWRTGSHGVRSPVWRLFRYILQPFTPPAVRPPTIHFWQ